ncbi:MAG: ferritin-like domain-containing protein [Gemmatimonadaceae bacterium]|nr:ferritin-like domain-containing protein [Gemmatimonadaceae bacterium]
MPTTDALQDLLIDELRDAYDAEKQLAKALRSMSRTAQSEELKEALTSHLEETNGHVEILESVFETLEVKPRGKHCAGIAGIITEGNEHTAEADEDVRDLVLIAGARRAEHYEMAAYMILVDLATAIGNEDIAGQFQTILEEEMAAEDALAELARSLVAMGDEEGEAEEEGGDEEEGDEEDEASDEDSEAPKSASGSSRGGRSGAAPRKTRRS